MKTIPLPDNFPLPKYQFGQLIKVRQGRHAISKAWEPVLGVITGLQWVDPSTAGQQGLGAGWLYAVSFVDLPQLPAGMGQLLDQPIEEAHEADLEAV